MDEENLCPFSKPIIGQWCQCKHARLLERCSGKMLCLNHDVNREACHGLVDRMVEQSRFILGLSDTRGELPHTHLMKVRCGGILGMQRVLQITPDQPPAVVDIIDKARMQYGAVEDFPFNEIVQDIKGFSHRNKSRDRA